MKGSGIRENYREEESWSVAEAADYGGVSPKTVQNWRFEHNFKPGNVKGSYVIDALSFRIFLETGEPQGDA